MGQTYIKISQKGYIHPIIFKVHSIEDNCVYYTTDRDKGYVGNTNIKTFLEQVIPYHILEKKVSLV